MPVTLLSPHFTLEELTASDTAVRFSINNTPEPLIVSNLKLLATYLERIRVVLARPIIIKSGYRSPELNSRVGGSPSSMHCLGLAADIVCPEFGPPATVCNAIVAAGIEFDQLIYEGTWTHFGLSTQGATRRREQLTAVFKPGQPTEYLPGIQVV